MSDEPTMISVEIGVLSDWIDTLNSGVVVDLSDVNDVSAMKATVISELQDRCKHVTRQIKQVAGFPEGANE